MIKFGKLLDDVEFTEADYQFFFENCGFTDRQRRIMELSKRGWSNTRISIHTGWSLSTIDKEIKIIKKRVLKVIINK